MKGPGILYVPAEPSSDLSEDFHDWYNNYHGPLRARLPFITNTLRYRASDSKKPGWLASYDFEDLAHIQERPYARLADERNAKEKDVLTKLDVLDRRIYSLISSRGSWTSPPPVFYAVAMTLDQKDLEEFNRWYEEEHTGLLAKIPGWVRTRRFILVEGDGPKFPQVECLAIHEFAADHGIGGPEHKHAASTPWRDEVMEIVVGPSRRRMYTFYHNFSPLPEPPEKSIGHNAIEGTIITNDGFPLKYRIDGPQDPGTPTIVFINSVLTTHHIWDRTIALLSPHFPNHRFVRYNPRGYAPLPFGTKPISIDVLADDVEYLLYRLSIPKATLIGVSMGGMTTLNVALRHPSLLQGFIACDCGVSANEVHRKAWDERIELARSQGGMDKLAGQTVNRWFLPGFVQAKSQSFEDVRAMIQGADVQGFIDSAHAICGFGIEKKLGEIKVRGACLAGAQDGGGGLPPIMELLRRISRVASSSQYLMQVTCPWWSSQSNLWTLSKVYLGREGRRFDRIHA